MVINQPCFQQAENYGNADHRQINAADEEDILEVIVIIMIK